MVKLLEKIATENPREKAGSIAYNRFDYQQDWALCKILDLHSTTFDYLICFDYYDDVVIMDSSADPHKISFYQVKTKHKGNWTTNDLIRQKKGADKKILNSHLGKSFYNYTLFKENTENINFISNASFSLKLADKSNSILKSRIVGYELDDAEIKKINTTLKKELNLLSDVEFEKVTIFEVAELKIDNHEELTSMKLARFIEASFPGTSYQITPVYKSIFGEIKRKAKYEKNVETKEDLIKNKAITKKDFDNYLKISVLYKRESFKDKCDKIENRLNSEKVDFAFLKIFKQRCIDIEIDKMNINNRLLENLTQMIKDIIKKFIMDQTSKELFGCMNIVYNKYLLLNIKQNSFDEHYLKTLILIELYEI